MLAGETMGTTWAVTLRAPDLSRSSHAAWRAIVQEELDRVNAAMSTWDPDSELSRFNAHVSMAPFSLSAATLSVMELSKEVGAASGGAFDVTVRPLVAAFGFGAGARVPGELPSEAELEEIRARVGADRLLLDPAAGQARKLHPLLEVELSAVAKGYGVEQVARRLIAEGQADFLVEVGGEIDARGQRPGGGPWRLAVERPEPDGRAVHAVVELSGLAMATSGDYRSFYEAGGEKLSHLLDPRIGRPIQHALASVSVVHVSAAAADAWATALFVLGPEDGPALAEERGIGAYFILRTDEDRYETRVTPGFPAILTPDGTPGEAPGPAGAGGKG
ncbi:MAG: FAD:protein FMN transferase ApbE [Deltaproteobacteria bacterium]|nr:FAD:protein FMN transferase ApbE [Deltaproteobacteria bacterium]